MPGKSFSDKERRLKEWWASGAGGESPQLAAIQVEAVEGAPGLRGIREIELEFRYPITAIVGPNGSGKSTLLALSALAFHHDDPRKRFTFGNFFYKGPTDPDITGLRIEWVYKNNPSRQSLSIKKQTKKWMEYARRPRRPVYLLRASRIVPAIELRVLKSHFSGKPKDPIGQLSEVSLQYLSRIFKREYDEANILKSYKYQLRTLKANEQTYSSFNTGSGEDAIADLLYVLQEAERGAFIAIEEVELGLHPRAVKELASVLVDIAYEKRLQIVVTTHSPDFMRSIPLDAIVLVQKTKTNGHELIYAPSIEFATLNISTPEAIEKIKIYVEDEVGKHVIQQLLSPDIRKLVNIIPVGGKDELAKVARGYLVSVRSERHKPVIIIWDGDVTESTVDAAINGLANAGFEKDDDYYLFRLPGSTPPEKYVFEQVLNNEDALKLAGYHFNVDHLVLRGDMELILSQSSDVHSYPYLLAQELGLEADSVMQELINVAIGQATVRSEFEHIEKLIREVTSQ